MSPQTENTTPKAVRQALEEAEMILGLNDTANRIKGFCDPDQPGRYRDPKDKLTQLFNDLGQRSLINLTRCFDEARIALALYAGGGIVAKIIPSDQLAKPNVVYHLPSICSYDVTAEGHNFVVKFYPYVAPGQITKADVAALGETIGSIGLSYTNGDDTTRNVHRLPDANRTLIGIDSNMFVGPDVEPSLADKWHAYMHELYPIYDIAEVPAQTEDTNFRFHSIHNRDTNLVGFDHRLEDPIIRAQKASQQTGNSLWNRLVASLG